MTTLRRSALAALIGLSLVGTASAQSTWAGASGNWSSTVSPGWTVGGVPNVIGATASNPSNTTGTTTQDIVAGATIGSLNFNSTTNTSWTILPTNVLTLNQDSGGAGVATISNSNSDTGTTNALILSTGTITLADNLLISNTGGSTNTTGAIQIIGTLGGAGNIRIVNNSNTLSATGSVRFQTGVNTFTGSVTIAQGTTSYNVATSLGNSANTIALGETGSNLSAAFISTTGLTGVPYNVTVANAGTGTRTLGSTSTAAGTYTGTVTLNGPVNLMSAATIGTNSLNFSGLVSGANSISIVGGGTTVLSNANVGYTAATNVLSGELALVQANSGGSGQINLGDTSGTSLASLRLAPTAATTYANNIVVVNGSSGVKSITNRLGFTATLSGTITMNAPLTISSNLAAAAITLTNTITNGGNLLTLSDNNTASITLDGAISGTGGVLVNGSSTTGAVAFATTPKTYSGNTTLTSGLSVAVISSSGTPGAPTDGPFGTGTLILNGGQIRGTSSGARTVLNNVTFQADTTVPSSQVTVFTLAGPMTLAGAGTTRTLTESSGTNGLTVISGAIAESGTVQNLTKAGGSTLALTAANTYTGTTTVTAGTLRIGNTTTTGSIAGPLTITAGTANWRRTDNITIANTITGAGTLSFGDTILTANYPTITLTGASTFAGPITINNGRVRILDSTGLGTGTKTITANNGTNGRPGIILDPGAGPAIVLPSTFTLNSSNNNATQPVIENASGNNSFLGNITLNSGGGDSTFYTTAGSLTLGQSGTFISAIATGPRAAILGGDSAGISQVNSVIQDGTTLGQFSAVQKNGTGVWVLNANNTYLGATTVAVGTLRTTAPNALGFGAITPVGTAPGATSVTAGATLDIAGQLGVQEVITLNGTGVGGNGALLNSSASPTSIGNGLASLAITAGGSGYSDLTTVSLAGGGGSGATATASLGVTAASFTIAGGTTVYSVAPTVAIAGGTGAVATANLTAGVVTSITVTGAGSGFTAAPTITFSGGTVTTAGTNPTGTGNSTNYTLAGIQLTNAGTGYTGTPTVSFTTGTGAVATANRTAVILGSNSTIGGTGNLTIDSIISGATFGLTKVGNNLLNLNAANTYTGATTVSAGTLRINGSIASAVSVNAGTLDGTGNGVTTGLISASVLIGNGVGTNDSILSPGNSIGTLTATGSLTLSSDALFAVELNSLLSTTDLMVANGVTIDPAASISFTDLSASLFTPGNYTIINNTSGSLISGAFSNLADGAAFDIGLNHYVASYTGGTGNDLVLAVSAIPEPSTLVLGGLALLGFAGAGLRRRRLAKQGA